MYTVAAKSAHRLVLSTTTMSANATTKAPSKLANTIDFGLQGGGRSVQVQAICAAWAHALTIDTWL